MRAISVHQPWAWAIFDPAANKNVENRTWATRHRGPLLIHAARTLITLEDQDPLEWSRRYGIDLPRAEVLTFGVILGLVDVIDCVPVGLNGRIGRHGHSVWAEVGGYAWVLERPRLFTEPIPHRGAQRLFDVPDETLPVALR